MGIISYYKLQKKNVGAVKGAYNTLIKSIKHVSGTDKLEDENEALWYFLNIFHDIKQVPPATGPLRELQKCDVVLLKIFDKICKKNGFSYWLDYGTLLGAYRHSGFIPWDDDLDVAMKREEYNKALPIFKVEMEKYGIEVDEKPEQPMARIGIGYKHQKTGVWLDVFAMDEILCEKPRDEVKKILEKKISYYRKYYVKNAAESSKEKLIKRKQEIINMPKGPFVVFYHCPEFLYAQFTMYDYDTIFPLRQISFEGHDFYCPNSCQTYLETYYGADYMQFPRGGVEHHGRGELRLSQWAAQSGTNMKEILNELNDIYNAI